MPGRTFGKLDNESMAQGRLPSLLEAFGRYSAAKVRAICAMALGISSFMQKASQVRKSKACAETVANDPGTWILKRGDG